MKSLKVNFESVSFVREVSKEGKLYNVVVIKFDSDFEIKFFLENNELLLLKKKFKLNTETVGVKLLEVNSITLVTDISKQKKEFTYLEIQFPFKYAKRVFPNGAEVALIDEFYSTGSEEVAKKLN